MLLSADVVLPPAASLTSKELTVENIKALNALLGITDVKPEDVLSALDKVRNPTEEPTDTVESPPADGTATASTEPSQTGGTVTA
jgi:hypothetical protein